MVNPINHQNNPDYLEEILPQDTLVNSSELYPVNTSTQSTLTNKVSKTASNASAFVENSNTQRQSIIKKVVDLSKVLNTKIKNYINIKKFANLTGISSSIIKKSLESKKSDSEFKSVNDELVSIYNTHKNLVKPYLNNKQMMKTIKDFINESETFELVSALSYLSIETESLEKLISDYKLQSPALQKAIVKNLLGLKTEQADVQNDEKDKEIYGWTMGNGQIYICNAKPNVERSEKPKIIKDICTSKEDDAIAFIYSKYTDTNVRASLLKDLSNSLAIDAKYPQEEDIIQKLKSVYSNNKVFNLLLELLDESTNEARKDTLAVLLIHTFGKSPIQLSGFNDMQNSVIYKIIKEELEVSQPDIKPIIDLLDIDLNNPSKGLNLKICTYLFRLLANYPSEERSQLIKLVTIPFSSDRNISINTMYKEMKIIIQILRDVSNKQTIDSLLVVLKKAQPEEIPTLTNYIDSFTSNLETEKKEEILQTLLDIPYEFWPAMGDFSTILYKERVLADITKIIEKKDEKQSTLDQISLLLEKSKLGEQEWDRYVVRDKKFENEKSYNNSGTQNQKKYGQLMYQATLETASLLEKGQAGFMKIMEFVGKQRRTIAYQLDHESREEFGLIRNKDSATPCRLLYKDLGDSLEIMSSDLRNNRINSDKIDFYNKHNNMDFIKTGVINNERITLTEIDFDEDERNVGETLVVVKHSPSEQLEKILPHLDHLYTNLLQMNVKSEEDKVRMLEISGEFFWWFCEAKPVKRGDPSMAEVMLRAVWNLKGMDNPRWEKDVIPWVEVVKELDVHQFGKNFHTLLENKTN